ncbi:hypothetical protein C8R45DRAFT_552639 [Mycena sanguinolenta]|nr:hypothetical protein C8R45DRAFT_552639 [Mycena sanguinolenta]
MTVGAALASGTPIAVKAATFPNAAVIPIIVVTLLGTEEVARHNGPAGSTSNAVDAGRASLRSITNVPRVHGKTPRQTRVPDKAKENIRLHPATSECHPPLPPPRRVLHALPFPPPSQRASESLRLSGSAPRLPSLRKRRSGLTRSRRADDRFPSHLNPQRPIPARPSPLDSPSPSAFASPHLRARPRRQLLPPSYQHSGAKITSRSS